MHEWQQRQEEDAPAPQDTATGYGLIANVLWDRVLRMGAKVYLLGWHGDYSSVYVWGLAKDGRPVRKYLLMKRLYHVRAAWFPPKQWALTWRRFATKARAEQVAQGMASYWAGVQCFTTDGSLLRPGLSEGEAWTRWLAGGGPDARPPET